jgi:hypothetical protein
VGRVTVSLRRSTTAALFCEHRSSLSGSVVDCVGILFIPPEKSSGFG